MNSRKTNEEWRIILKQRVKSGLSVKKWCDRNNISYDTYKYWEKKLRKLGQDIDTADQTAFVELPIAPVTVISPVSGQLYSFQITYREITLGISDTADISVLAGILKTLQVLC